ncbi:MAG: type II toxin-antitoxin system VapC family toxin [Candidatus Bathyarchaeota archaeon]|nr:type II toxin-antitoxin system VapC family toxin [Candidatus Bathyarchaeota archaeon]
MVCLDTDILVSLLRGDAQATAYIGRLESGGEPAYTTPVNAHELFLGGWRSRRREANLREIASLLGDLSILDFDLEASFYTGRIASKLLAEGHQIGAGDTLVAGIALRHGQPLATRNARHFSRIPELRIEAW